MDEHAFEWKEKKKKITGAIYQLSVETSSGSRVWIFFLIGMISYEKSTITK